MSRVRNSRARAGRRERFQKYLDENRVMDDIAKALVSLNEEPEKPEDPIRYVCDKLLAQLGIDTLESLNNQLCEAEDKVVELRKERARLLRNENQEESYEVDAESCQQNVNYAKSAQRVTLGDIRMEFDQEVPTYAEIDLKTG